MPTKQARDFHSAARRDYCGKPIYCDFSVAATIQKQPGKASPENVGGRSPNWRSRAAIGRVSPAVLIVPGEALSATIGHFANISVARVNQKAGGVRSPIRLAVAVGTIIAGRPPTGPYVRFYAYGSRLGWLASKRCIG